MILNARFAAHLDDPDGQPFDQRGIVGSGRWPRPHLAPRPARRGESPAASGPRRAATDQPSRRAPRCPSTLLDRVGHRPRRDDGVRAGTSAATTRVITSAGTNGHRRHEPGRIRPRGHGRNPSATDSWRVAPRRPPHLRHERGVSHNLGGRHETTIPVRAAARRCGSRACSSSVRPRMRRTPWGCRRRAASRPGATRMAATII